MPEYDNGKVYAIRNRADNDRIVYVGSTVRPLSERMAKHRRSAANRMPGKIYTMMNESGIENFHIELLCDYPCERREQLLAMEGEYMRVHGTVGVGNTYTAQGRAWTHDETREYMRNYRALHGDTMREQTRQWRERKRRERELRQQNPEDIV